MIDCTSAGQVFLLSGDVYPLATYYYDQQNESCNGCGNARPCRDDAPASLVGLCRGRGSLKGRAARRLVVDRCTGCAAGCGTMLTMDGSLELTSQLVL